MSQCCPQPLPSVPAGDADVIVTGLYREHGAIVLSYVTRLVRDRFLAEDVVQETMLRAWRHCGDLDPRGRGLAARRPPAGVQRAGAGAVPRGGAR